MDAVSICFYILSWFQVRAWYNRPGIIFQTVSHHTFCLYAAYADFLSQRAESAQLRTSQKEIKNLYLNTFWLLLPVRASHSSGVLQRPPAFEFRLQNVRQAMPLQNADSAAVFMSDGFTLMGLPY